MLAPDKSRPITRRASVGVLVPDSIADKNKDWGVNIKRQLLYVKIQVRWPCNPLRNAYIAVLTR
jgi:hypothetical protein